MRFLRMHAATKAGVVGSGLILIGVGFAFGDADTWLRVVVIVLLLLVTTPVSAHALGLGAYLGGARLWGGTTADELAGVLRRHDFDAPAEGEAGSPELTPPLRARTRMRQRHGLRACGGRRSSEDRAGARPAATARAHGGCRDSGNRCASTGSSAETRGRTRAFVPLQCLPRSSRR